MRIRIDPVDGLLFVDAASTASLTLSGLQTVDGVSLVAGQLCLAKDQASIRAVYMAQSGPWIPVDPGVGFGLQVCVRGGSQANSIYRCTTADPIVWGTTPATFVVAAGSGGAAFDPHSPGPLGDVTPSTGAFDHIYLSQTLNAIKPNTLQLLTASDFSQLIRVNPDGGEYVDGFEPTSPTVHIVERCLAINLAPNATYDFNNQSTGGIWELAVPGSSGSTFATGSLAANGAPSTGGLTYVGFSTTLGTPGSINVGASGGLFRIENKLLAAVKVIAKFVLLFST